ncbi:MAG: PH domain-containing protein [Propionibacteriaceae bacterium]|jgi:putative membrane protein|nr:PH domain-containing protein [Propionibacteriaceae bacterium]
MLLVLVGLVPPYVIYALIVGPWNMLPALVPALLAVGAVYVRGIGKQWNYQLLKSPSGLRISRGLTQLSSYSIPAKRIQAIEISQPLIWRVLGIYKVRAGIIGSGGEKAEDAEGHVLLPVGSWDEVVMLLRELWPHAWFGDVQLQHVSRSARWFHPFARPFMGWGYNSMFFVVKHGWWFRKYCIVPHSKVQAYQLRRGPFDRRLNTAKLGSKTPEHEVEPSISGIPIADAQRAFADLSGLLMHNEGKLI